MTDTPTDRPGPLTTRLLAALRDRRPLPLPGIVDAHAHLGPYSLFHIPRPDAATMVEVMDRTGVACAAIAANRAIQLEAYLGNEEVLRVSGEHPGRFLPLGVVNPWQDPDDVAAGIATDTRFRGIKVHPDLARHPVDGPGYAPAFEAAERAGLPVLTHTWDDSAWSSPQRIDVLARRHPRVTIVMGHAGGTPTGLRAAADLARRHTGVVLEVCGSVITGTTLAGLVARAGADKVMFGSDFPFIDQRFSLGRVVAAGLPDMALRAVLVDNATRVYGTSAVAAAAPVPVPVRGQA